MKSNLFRSALLLGTLALVASCGGATESSAGPTGPISGNGTKPTPTPTKIQISPRPDTSLVKHLEGDTVDLQVTAFDSAGNSVALPAAVIWTGSDSAFTISSSGIVTVLETGVGHAIATSGALADTIAFRLDVTPDVALRIAPRTDTVQYHVLDDTIQLAATVTDLFLHKDLTHVTQIEWSSLDTTATVTPTGGVIVHKTGTVNIVASAGRLADTASFAVNVSLPRLRLVSINGVDVNLSGPTAVADSFDVVIEVRNPSTGSVINTVLFSTSSPSPRTVTPPAPSNIQPGETALVGVRDPYAPAGSYNVHAATHAGSIGVSGAEVPVDVTNSDAIPPELRSLNPSSDTTWAAGTPLLITFNEVDLQSGVDGFTTQSTWASPQPAGCIDNEAGGVDPHSDFQGIPVTLEFKGCLVPLGVNTIIITAVDRAGNTTVKTLKITGI
ncbi:MAG: hypothetical protein ABI035_13460 [Gemmatimonadaceae bacterium]